MTSDIHCYDDSLSHIVSYILVLFVLSLGSCSGSLRMNPNERILERIQTTTSVIRWPTFIVAINVRCMTDVVRSLNPIFQAGFIRSDSEQLIPFPTPCSVPIPSLSCDRLWSLQIMICICCLKFCSSFHSIFALKISWISIVISEPEECLAFRLFLDKVPNMYVNLKKKIEISHLQGSVVMFILYLFYSKLSTNIIHRKFK